MIFKTCRLSIIIVLFGFIFVHCEGPAGPPGEDANKTCSQCHNGSSVILSKELQTAQSGHLKGGNYIHNNAECAPCHTNEGFIECLQTGSMTSSVPLDPTPPNCRTCHNIHKKYDSTDYSLRTQAPVKLWLNNQEVDGGIGNICIQCHQPRIPSPMPQEGGPNITITSPGWGVHFGTQAAIYYKTGGYEISGSEPYSSSHHHEIIEKSCVQCHMTQPIGNESGGHTFNLAYIEQGKLIYNISACISCHSEGNAKIMISIVTKEIDSLLLRVENGLKNDNILTPAGSINLGPSGSLNLTANQAGALHNYFLIKNDASHGLHNYPYCKALLKNTIQMQQY